MAVVGDLLAVLRLDSAGFQRGINQSMTQMQRMRKESKTLASQIFSLRGAMLATGGVAMFVQASKAGLDFERQLKQIIGLVGVAEESVAGMRKEVLELSKSTGKGPQELGQALFFITSAGLRGQAALDALESSARASASGLGETKTVADAVTSAMNAYGPAVLNAESATDVLVATVREGKAEAASLAGQFGRLLPAANELHISFDQVGAGLAFLTRSTGDASQASTQLGGIMNKLLKPTETGRKVLADYGMSVDGLRESIRQKGLLAALVELREGLGGNTDALGKIFEDAQALNGVLQLTGEQAGTAAKVFDSLAQSAGATEKTFKLTEDGLRKVQRAQAELDVAMVRFSDSTLPHVVSGMALVITKASEVSQDIQIAAENVAAFLHGPGGGNEDLVPRRIEQIKNRIQELQEEIDGAGFASDFWSALTNPMTMVEGLGGAVSNVESKRKEIADLRAEIVKLQDTGPVKVGPIELGGHLADEFDQLIKDINAVNESAGDTSGIVKQKGALSELQKEIQSSRSDFVSLQKAIETEQRAMQAEISTGRDAANAIRLRARFMDQLNAVLADNNDLTDKEIANLKKSFEANQKLREEVAKQAEMRAAAQKAAEAMQQPFENAFENIQRAWGDTLTDMFRNGVDGFKDFGDSVKDIFARLAGELVAMWSARVIRQIATGTSAAAFAGSASAGGSAAVGSAPGLLQQAGQLLGLPNLGGGALGAGAMGAGVGGLLAGLSGTSTSAGQVGAGLGSLIGYSGSTMFAGLGGLAGGVAGFAGAAGGEWLADAFGLQNPEQAGMLGGIGAAVGMGLGGPLGALAGGALGSLVGGSFGGGYDDPDFMFGTQETAAGLLAAQQTPFGTVGLVAAATENLSPETMQRFSDFVAQLDRQIATNLTQAEIEAAKEAAQNARLPRVSVGATLTPDELVFAIRDRYQAIMESLGVSRGGITSADPGEFAQQIMRNFQSFTQPRIGVQQQLAQLMPAIEQEANMLMRLREGVGDASARISDFLTGLVTGPSSVLAPREALANTRARFEELAAQARAGDMQALQQVSGAGQQLLDISRNLFASSPEFFQRFDFVQSTLQDLQTNAQAQQDRAGTLLSEIGIQIQSGNQEQGRLLTTATDRLTDLVDQMRELNDSLQRELGLT
ncbi:MAG: phage tail tape measure protein [Spongiibacteraceae bacterium]|uniref:phage tail tape measure protein n=1 Tax=uncultured Haliea sp. TaxID=622616 RepID=UPI000C3F154A|nr:phage tail tape measure protein [Spongiibacteraceae bacterium]|tara:strand:+ start:1456 stop:4884 length:3429 start_codon:yes stop_codon:yes gene_type:complete